MVKLSVTITKKLITFKPQYIFIAILLFWSIATFSREKWYLLNYYCFGILNSSLL